MRTINVLVGLCILTTSTYVAAEPDIEIDLENAECWIDFEDPVYDPSVADGCKYGWHLASVPYNNAPYKQGYFTSLKQGTCYIDKNDNTVCYWKDPQQACNDLVTINDTIENYGTKFVTATVQPTSNPSIKKCHTGSGQDMALYLDPMPQRSEKVQLTFPNLLTGTMQTWVTAIEGPYRNMQFPSSYIQKGKLLMAPVAGGHYKCTSVPGEGNKSLRDLVIERNKSKAPIGMIKSDLAGFVYKQANEACIEEAPNKPGYCIEPTYLDPNGKLKNGVNLHHVARRRTQTGCDWGSNSYKNGVLISRQLNGIFSNTYPGYFEINRVKSAPLY